MDRLIAETEVKEKNVEILTQNVQKTQKNEEISQKIQEKQENFPQTQSQKYLNSFENLTVADIKRQEEQKKQKEFEKEKEQLIEQQFVEEKVENQQPQETPQDAAKPQNIIEKPNYDLIEENPKIVKIKSKTKTKKSITKKTAAIVLSCALGVTGIITVANAIAIDQMQSSFSQIETTYNLKLREYLQHITELDGTKMGSEVIETYPDETKNAGDLGTKSNWFDRLCNFIARLFGG